MASVSFTNLKLGIEKEVNIVDFDGTKIEVLKYLPVEDKKDLVQITLQKSYEDGIYNDILLDVYFHLNIIYLYTNLNITAKQKEDEFKLYDKIKSSGLLDVVLDGIDDAEYSYLYNSLEKAVADYMTYKTSAAAVVQNIIQDLPGQAAQAAEIINTFDADKFQNVQDMIKMANASGMNNSVARADEGKIVQFLQNEAKQGE